MFGAFKPTAPLSGGLLWKIPWRLSSPQKLRHRRRMRRVDNVVTVLNSALHRHVKSGRSKTWQEKQAESLPKVQNQEGTRGEATSEDLSQTAEGLRMLARDSDAQSNLSARRHGKGPKEGEFLPAQTSPPSSAPHHTSKLLSQEAAERKTIKLIERWRAEMPTEQEMLPKDKYSMFDKKVRGYRKGVHKLPKWTRVSQRLNPPGF
ncbi:54S ribosomal L31, mitochondrial [Lecanosticta acicola]|uniref:54S ribosomal L31, mitochondrial n=1 Tax=Lecanosticta acicola TaxID=111012 RepID=A0AAI8Z0R8_9PEZI|nr:54S ribosomal L31, mitochondrial [Lecanosticta acicola]